MANIFNREINGVSVTYDSETKNQLGVKAIARDTKRAIAREAVYKNGGVAIVVLDDDTIAELGTPTQVGEIDLVAFTKNMFVADSASAATGSETAEVKFAKKATKKLIVIDLAPAA